MLWSHATECVRSGDLNRAYVEILGSGDELLLMWMMSRTGPVLHQLNPAAVLQLIQCYMHAPTAGLPRDCDPLDSAGIRLCHKKWCSLFGTNWRSNQGAYDGFARCLGYGADRELDEQHNLTCCYAIVKHQVSKHGNPRVAL
jgi:hypothetical protein